MLILSTTVFVVISFTNIFNANIVGVNRQHRLSWLRLELIKGTSTKLGSDSCRALNAREI
jgi:hypothetical protein